MGHPVRCPSLRGIPHDLERYETCDCDCLETAQPIQRDDDVSPPVLYATDRGTYVIQGKIVTDREALADLLDVGEDEFYVEISKGLLRFAQDGE